VPGNTSKVCATCGRRPTGRNSVVTNANAPTVTDATASHARNGEDVPSATSGVLLEALFSKFMSLSLIDEWVRGVRRRTLHH
jgi:hypothetical protein